MPGPVGFDPSALLGVGPDVRASAEPLAVARQVSAVFLTELIAAMRRTVPENDWLPRTPERDVWGGVFDRTMAERLSEADPFGLAATFAGPPAEPVLKSPAISADVPSSRQGTREGP